jgi:disulfide bond formation protein DsbB
MNALQRRALGPMLGSLGLLAGALAFQYIGGLAPCPLCIDQRWPHEIAIGLGLLLLAWPRRGLAVLAGLVVLVGAGIAAYHVGIEQGWWPGPTTCTAPEPGAMAPGELLDQILETPVVLCDQVAWSLWGISMAGWNGILSLGIAWLWFRAGASTR